MNEEETKNELQDAWRIIQTLHSERLDEGESWPRALQWLERNERFRVPAPSSPPASP